MENKNKYIHNNYDWLLDEEALDTGTPKTTRQQESDWGNPDPNNTDWTDDYVEEYRVDPFDFKLYNRKEFFDYYGRYLEWDLQDPRLIIRRKNIDEMIMSYKDHLYVENINFLLNKIIETFI